MTRFAALALLAACGGPFTPASGTWEITDISPSVDECDFFGQMDLSDLTVVSTVAATAGESTFTAAVAAVSVELTCTLDGKDFDCTQDPNVNDMTADGIDVVLTYEPFANGTFEDESTASITAGYTRACAGTQCADAEAEGGPWPDCSVSATAAMSLRE
jgi:hypothetical protein